MTVTSLPTVPAYVEAKKRRDDAVAAVRAAVRAAHASDPGSWRRDRVFILAQKEERAAAQKLADVEREVHMADLNREGRER